MRRERLAKEGLRGRDTPVTPHQKINSLALLVYRPIQVVPFASNRDVSLIYSPGGAHASRITVPALLELGYIPNHPSQNRCMRNHDAAFGHDFNEVSIAQPIRDVPAYAQLNDVGVEYSSAVNGITSDRPGHSHL